MITKHTIPVILILAISLLLGSCEDVIHLELKNSAPRTVIEATINASSGECVVRATKSAGFYDSANLAGIEGATVGIVSGSGTSITLPETGPGIYSASNLTVIPGEVYRVTISVSSEETYMAETRAPEAVFLDSLKVVRGFGDPRPTAPPVYLVNPKWKDPAGIANYYRFKVTKNGRLREGSFTILSDEQLDGTVVDMPLYRFDFGLGDSVKLEFQTIDSVSFSYYSQVNDMARPSFVSATPYNPIGNFDHGALGYFGIFFSETRELIVSTGR